MNCNARACRVNSMFRVAPPAISSNERDFFGLFSHCSVVGKLLSCLHSYNPVGHLGDAKFWGSRKKKKLFFRLDFQTWHSHSSLISIWWKQKQRRTQGLVLKVVSLDTHTFLFVVQLCTSSGWGKQSSLSGSQTLCLKVSMSPYFPQSWNPRAAGGQEWEAWCRVRPTPVLSTLHTTSQPQLWTSELYCFVQLWSKWS